VRDAAPPTNRKKERKIKRMTGDFITIVKWVTTEQELRIQSLTLLQAVSYSSLVAKSLIREISGNDLSATLYYPLMLLYNPGVENKQADIRVIWSNQLIVQQG
jgi:hypothetical protein